MKILVTGVNGQLGHDVVNELDKRGITCRGVDIQDFDLTIEADVLYAIQSYAPDAVIHCAAYTAVDRAEDEKELCYNINVLGTRYVAQACKKLGCKLMYISTDYVFDGQGENPWTPDSPKRPCNYYGESKSLGEDEVTALLASYFIVRISWVFGKNGNNFVKTMLRLGKERDSLTVVADQFGSPTYTYDLAPLLCDMIHTKHYGIYHATNEGVCSWYDFARAIIEQAELPAKVLPITTDQYPTKAVRPKNSRMSKDKLTQYGFSLLPPWQDALKHYLQTIMPEKLC
ncbi:MAG: dTDP-4-dehydrorhamnose reductase [Christensenellales bacterium]|jgi:dTDP-4-dehydrorhamnose reductase